MDAALESYLRNEVKIAMMKDTILDLQEKNIKLREQLEASERENEELRIRLKKLTNK